MSVTTIRRLLAGTVPALVLALTGCAGTPSSPATTPETTPETTRTPAGTPTRTPAPNLVDWPTRTHRPQVEHRQPPARKPVRRFSLSIPSIGIGSLPVVAYNGRPDDGPGTRIQDGDIAASPRGPKGGRAPGEVGNLIVTAHRTSGAAPFRDLPDLRNGQPVEVSAGDRVYVYEVTETRQTSFRSARSLAEQAAPVPGHPGRRPTRSVITLSTCATPEDRAAGNFWSDQYGNPEHRIDKIGVLVEIRPAA